MKTAKAEELLLSSGERFKFYFSGPYDLPASSAMDSAHTAIMALTLLLCTLFVIERVESSADVADNSMQQGGDSSPYIAVEPYHPPARPYFFGDLHTAKEPAQNDRAKVCPKRENFPFVEWEYE